MQPKVDRLLLNRMQDASAAVVTFLVSAQLVDECQNTPKQDTESAWPMVSTSCIGGLPRSKLNDEMYTNAVPFFFVFHIGS